MTKSSLKQAPEGSGSKAGRERRCIVTGDVLPEARLIRFVLAPDRNIVPDVSAKLPGRGAWVTASRAHVEAAQKEGGFARAFKQQVPPRADLADLTEQLLVKRCLDLLGMARKAGAIALGAAQVEAAFRVRPALLWIEASDGAADGREGLASLHQRLWDRLPPIAGSFSAAELGMALGRDRVIHACLLQERLALAWAADVARLAGFRAIVPSSWPVSWRSFGLGLGGADAEPPRSALEHETKQGLD